MKRLLAGALIAGAVGVAAPAATGATVWMCGPMVKADPCAGSLETTVVDEAGFSRVETPTRVREPEFDCFYVYPTVSQDLSENSDRSIDPEMVAVAEHQAQRFSQHCRVFAPAYRQRTLAALGAGLVAGSLQDRTRTESLAYGDVLEAWREYMSRHNGGRGVVLIGHSQGTGQLRRLAHREIDGVPDVRRRLISAVLLGGGIHVQKSADRGGDFTNIPTCRSQSSVGCVIAFSTFGETPPDSTIFGRPTRLVDGAPAPADRFEIACVDPATLRGRAGAVYETLIRGKAFPGVLGAVELLHFGGSLPPTADTPWLRPRDRYTGACVRENGAHVLKIAPTPGSRTLQPSPYAAWGLHLLDGNIALGDLVDVVAAQAAAYRAGLTALGVRLRRRGARLVAAVTGPPGTRSVVALTRGGRRVGRRTVVVPGAARWIVRRPGTYRVVVDGRVRSAAVRVR